jgi:hypothetical protein
MYNVRCHAEPPEGTQLITRRATARDAFDSWTAQLGALFRRIEDAAPPAGWTASRDRVEIQEDPFGLGASVPYEAPVLVLRRKRNGAEQRVTFEPRRRFAVGAAGRIDVYSHPALREAMLLRIPNPADAAGLTWEEADALAADTPWKAFSEERLPLSVDLADNRSLLGFLDDMVA